MVILSDRWDDEAAQITLLLLFTTEEAEDVETETTDAEACNAFVNIFFSLSFSSRFVCIICKSSCGVCYIVTERKLIYFPEGSVLSGDAILSFFL